MTRKKVVFEIIDSPDGKDVFVVIDGVKIAKRGRPETKHAGTWVSLEPGWEVNSPPDHSFIEVIHEGVRVH
jgi:hypothetical protein